MIHEHELLSKDFCKFQSILENEIRMSRKVFAF